MLLRERYRAKYGLTSAEMDDEPFEEVLNNVAIWDKDAKREKREQMREQQRYQNRS